MTLLMTSQTAENTPPPNADAAPMLRVAWRACLCRAPQPITIKWLEIAMNVPWTCARKYIRELRAAKCLVRIGGDGQGVRFEVVPGAVLPVDGRGRHWEQKREEKRNSKLSGQAARPHSVVTAGRIVPRETKRERRKIRA